MQVSPNQHGRSSDELDHFLGFTGEPLNVCTRISNTSSIQDAAALANEVRQIKCQIYRCESHRTVASHILPKGITPQAVLTLETIAETYRSVAFLYLQSVLHRMRIRGIIAPESHASLISAIPVSKSQALGRCVSLVESCGTEQPRSELNTLIFPLFLVGCERETTSQEAFVLRVLTRMERDFGHGHVSEAKRIVRTRVGL